jgi:hypothetical protein
MQIIELQVNSVNMNDIIKWIETNKIDCRILLGGHGSDPYNRVDIRNFTIEEWAKNMNAFWYLDFEFYNDDDAMLFKLTYR